MKNKALQSSILFFALFISFSAFAQEQVDYAKELAILKKQVAALQQQAEEQKSERNNANSNIFNRTKISSFAIFRPAEYDWNQIVYNPEIKSGEHVHPRFWSRILAYVFLDTKVTDKLDFRFSLMNFPIFINGGTSDSRLNILLDEVWLKYQFTENQYVKLGRQDASEIWPNQIGNQFDFWKHDGISYQYKNNLNSDLTFYGKAAFYIESYKNNTAFKNQGSMYGFSLNLQQNKENNSFGISSGIIKAQGLINQFTSDIQNGMWDGDLAPDYTIWANQLTYQIKSLNNLTFKVDFYQNFKNYKHGMDSNLITDANGEISFKKDKDGNNIPNNSFNKNTAPNFSNQRTGVYASVKSDLPFISKNLSLAVAYMYMEKYAAIDYFA